MEDWTSGMQYGVDIELSYEKNENEISCHSLALLHTDPQVTFISLS